MIFLENIFLSIVRYINRGSERSKEAVKNIALSFLSGSVSGDAKREPSRELNEKDMRGGFCPPFR